MLPKNWRISKKEFPYILSKGKRYNSPLFLMYIVSGGILASKNSRFAFSVSKKVTKTAVERNRLRRQGYAVVQKHKKDIVSGYLVFFSFKKHLKKVNFESLESEIMELLSVSGVVS